MDFSSLRLFVVLLFTTVFGCEGPLFPVGHTAPVIAPVVAPEKNQQEPIPIPNIQPEITIRGLPTNPPVAFEEKPDETVQATTQLDDFIANESEMATESEPDPESATNTKIDKKTDTEAEASEAIGFLLLGQRVAPGELRNIDWSASETFSGTAIPNSVLVVNGREPGPVLCLTAAVHGDELNGIETVRRVIHNLKPEKLHGTLIGVPIVNLQGFQRHSRYLPDRRDLNRFFPGSPRGSSASRIAHSLFANVITKCDGLVDLHTGSFHRTNLPQLRANLNDEGVVALTEGFGATVILHSEGMEGTLRYAAVEAGIPAVTLEAGEPLRVQDDAVKHAVKGIHTLLDTLGMYARRSFWGNPEPTYYTSQWVRADQGGILFGEVKLGKQVKQGDLLGTVTDPITNESSSILSPHTGRVIGMALNQFVMPGYATFHIGLEAEVDDATVETPEVDLEHAIVLYEADAGEPE